MEIYWIARIWYTIPVLNKTVSAWVREEFALDNPECATRFESESQAVIHIHDFGMDNITRIEIRRIVK